MHILFGIQASMANNSQSNLS